MASKVKLARGFLAFMNIFFSFLSRLSTVGEKTWRSLNISHHNVSIPTRPPPFPFFTND